MHSHYSSSPSSPSSYSSGAEEIMKPSRKRARRLWSRRGLSTVVANMMMIGITLSLAAMLVAWTGQSYGAFSGGTGVYYQERGQALEEYFVIEEIFFEKNTTGQIFVFVRNVGLININVAAIYQNGTAITSYKFSTCGTPGASSTSGSIGVSQVCELSWTPPQTWSSDGGSSTLWNTGDIFYIVVASQRGNQVTYTSRAP